MSYEVIDHPELKHPVVNLPVDHIMVTAQAPNLAPSFPETGAPEVHSRFVDRVRKLGQVLLGRSKQENHVIHQTDISRPTPELTAEAAPVVAGESETAVLEPTSEKRSFLSRIRGFGARMMSGVVESYKEHRADIKRDDKLLGFIDENMDNFVFGGMGTSDVTSEYVPLSESFGSVEVDPGQKWATIYAPNQDHDAIKAPTMQMPVYNKPSKPVVVPAAQQDRSLGTERDLRDYATPRYGAVYASERSVDHRPKDLGDYMAVKAATTMPEPQSPDQFMLVEAMKQRPATLADLQNIENGQDVEPQTVVTEYRGRHHVGRAQTLEDVLSGKPVDAEV
jgi:hypothetical protein